MPGTALVKVFLETSLLLTEDLELCLLLERFRPESCFIFELLNLMLPFLELLEDLGVEAIDR
jgi:hypothetical protein